MFMLKLRDRLKGLLHGAGKPCLICGRDTSRNSSESVSHEFREHARLLGLCTSCSSSIPWILDIRCAVCGRAIDCPDCARRSLSPFVGNRSAVRYDDTMKQWLGLYKYRGLERMEPVFSAMLVHAYQILRYHWFPGQKELPILTFVPVSDKRLQERGFNQAERFAAGLSKRTGTPLIPMLARTRHTDKQSFKSRQERLRDMEGAFELLSAAPAQLPSTIPIIVVDDVYTTGSTLYQCAAALKHRYPNPVYGLTWAR